MFCAFLSFADFSKSTCSKNSFRNTIRVSNNLYQDQAQHFVGPDLGPNCLQRLSYQHTILVGKALEMNYFKSCGHSMRLFFWHPKQMFKMISKKLYTFISKKLVHQDPAMDPSKEHYIFFYMNDYLSGAMLTYGITRKPREWTTVATFYNMGTYNYVTIIQVHRR